VGIKGAGEMASAVAWRLFMANIRLIFMMEMPAPLAVRRGVAFSEAIHDGSKMVEGVQAVRATRAEEIPGAWDHGEIAVIADPRWQTLPKIRPDVAVDAMLAKRNLGTRPSDAPLVIGLGPGFIAGEDVHWVVETNRGHNLGRIIASGPAEADTGVPGPVGGFTTSRVLRASVEGEFRSERRIGDSVRKGDPIGWIGETDLVAPIDGVLRGLIRPLTWVSKGLKLGDIDPRGDVGSCFTISDKSRAIAGSVLEAILRVFNH
jgi:xanthine dehydrogenase accessory factor